MSLVTLHLGDCLDVMVSMPDNSVDAIVTDPPYGLQFMGKDWDKGVPGVHFWIEMIRILKPGGHLLSFGGTRTYHRMATAIEDAGFEVRDMLAWIYGSGFPKSLDISKAIDKMAGAERNVIIGTRNRNVKPYNDNNGWNKNNTTGDFNYTAPSTPEAQQWDGFGTALKPAQEPICLARKPISEKTIAANVLEHGTGGLNIDGCRVGTNGARNNGCKPDDNGYGANHGIYGKFKATTKQDYNKGRFPANVLHDGSDEVMGVFPNSTSTGGNGSASKNYISNGRTVTGSCQATGGFGDSGSASRFFYCAKASRSERNAGLEEFEVRPAGMVPDRDIAKLNRNGRNPVYQNYHPTVKPIACMRWLCRLITPPGGIVLDPFMGSGTTGIAAVQEGFEFIGIEMNAEYYEIAERRIKDAQQQMILPLELV